MIIVKVLLSVTLLIVSLLGFFCTFSREKDDEYFSEMVNDGSGISTAFGLVGLLILKLSKFIFPKKWYYNVFRVISFIFAIFILAIKILIWFVDLKIM
ncbi:hypothetical protein [Bacillus swezeyi]|uniref:hypothetical protein n=1 Tax=Bacillus swezeyi TaxID=1925020 RepID=UPI003F8B43E6